MSSFLDEKHLNEVRSAGTLVQHIEPLSYAQRVEYMIFVGRTALKPAFEHAVRILTDMAMSEHHYYRFMSIEGLRAYLLGKPQQLPATVERAVENLLFDSARSVYMRAASLAGKLFRSSDVLRLSAELPHHHLKLFCGHLCAAGQLSVLDECFRLPTTKNDSHRRNIIGAFISGKAMADMPADTFLGLWHKTHTSLCHRVPEAFVQCVQTIIKTDHQAEKEGNDEPLPVSIRDVVKIAISVLHRTSQVILGLSMMRLYLHRLDLTPKEMQKHFIPYLNRYPTECSEYLMEHREMTEGNTRISRRMMHRLMRALPTATLLRMVEVGFFPVHLFAQFSAELRNEIYSNNRDLLLSEGVMERRYIDHLHSEEARQREAVKFFEDRSLDAMHKITSLKVLPFPTIVSIAKEYIGNPVVEYRMECIGALVSSVAYHPEHMQKLLEFCYARRNEQDPYRTTLLYALAGLHSTVWEEHHLPLLEKILRTYLTAKDFTSAYAVVQVLLRVARQFPVFAAEMMKIFIQFDRKSVPREAWLPVDVIRKMLTVLIPCQHVGVNEESERYAIALFDCFHPHLLKQLAAEYETVCHHYMKCRNPRIAKVGLQKLLYLSPRSKQEQIVTDLLSAEPDWIYVDEVQQVLCNSIQGPLLSRFLNPLKHLRGKMVPKEHEDKIHYIRLPIAKAYRWTEKQQKAFAMTLLSMIEHNTEHQTYVNRNAISSITCLPSLEMFDQFEAFLNQNPEEALVSCALGALGNMNDKKSMAILCKVAAEEGEKSRARDAVPPIIKRLRRLPYSKAARYFDILLASKAITVQKAAVIALGEFTAEEAFLRLQRFEETKGDDLHKDVRIALLHAYWSFMWKPEVWELYDQIARGPRAAATIALMSIPSDYLTTSWQREHFNSLVLTLLRSEDDSVVLAALQRLHQPQVLEDSRWYPAIYHIMEQVDRLRLQKKSCDVILSLRVPPNELTQSVSVLSSDTSLESFVSSLNSSSKHMTDVALALVDKLLASRRQPCLAARCVMLCSPLSWLLLFQRFQEEGLLHIGVQFTILHKLPNISRRGKLYAEELQQIEKGELRRHEDVFFRRLGYEVLLQLVGYNRSGWTAEYRAALKTYQDDEQRWVSDDAKLITPKEM